MSVHKIIVIEDDHAIAHMYEFKLEQSGYKTAVAYDGRAGLELIQEFAPDLILLDLKMPVMNGDAMLEQLRTHDWGKNVQVIVLTNISRSEAPSSLRFLGVDRYVIKAHHTPAQIVEIVREVLR